ncbi:MAG: HAMP domain-containing protein [Actinobacteria bacterium]|nr:HAMP domain-containing protein [Actinomycetota bacterium]
MNSAQQKLLGQVQATAADLQASAQREATLYLTGAVGAIAIALIFAFFVARATTVPLKRLTSAAYSLSTDKLPALVERLRNPDESEGESLAETLTPIDINSKDEIGQLADAFNSIQQVTIEVAEEQAALLRKGIGDIFINLARRNQTLLDRQIEFIDQLEANEEDPDQLDNLFKLDHLATRMRRNAESLLVLAGAEPPRRRGRPVALADVVRVAIGEVEDFARIQLLALDDATVGGNVAVDLAHLLSELMENATHFSPPDTMVEIVGHRSDDGSYIISVSDQGIGMSAEQLAEANIQLARPPLVGLALSRSLGFIVIGRLAQRFDISVKLTASPSGGVTALVSLPTVIVTYEGEEPSAVMSQRALDEVPVPVEEMAEASDPATIPDAAVPGDDMIVLHDDELVVVDEDDDDVDSLLDELVDETPIEVPEDEAFDRGLQSIVDEELPPGPVESDIPGTPPTEPETTFPEPAAEAEPLAAPEPAIAEPVAEADKAPAPAGITVAEQVTAAARAEAKAAEMTAAGLVKRTPKKKSADAEWTPPNAEAAPVKSTGQTHRSPEEVRKMLSRYRSGLNRGKIGTTPTDKTES